MFFVSFWKIALENLPDGSFRNRRVTPGVAKRFVDEARQKRKLRCVSYIDLLAPYHRKERENHNALSRVLKKHFGIQLPFREFCTAPGDDGLYFTYPLECAEIAGSDRLMVINCTYTQIKRKKAPLAFFQIDPSSITFHVIEAK